MMDRKQFTLAIESHSSQLLAHALKFTRDQDDAKDLVQETMIKGIRFADKFNTGTNIQGWLYVIMKNTYINEFNKSSRRNAILTVEESLTNVQLLNSSTRNDGEAKFAMDDIAKAMNSIKPVYRIPFQRYFEGYKYEEIAEELNLPIGTIKTHIHQARIGLKKYLKVYRE